MPRADVRGQRLRGRLDHLLDRKVQRGLDSVDPAVRDALRLGLYQILYMDGVPEYAAVSQAVDLARSVGGKGVAGFVNAVLRAAAGEGGGEKHFPDVEADPAGFLSAWGSHPRWLVERWLRRWSPAEVWRLVQANNAVPPIYLRCLRDTPEEAVELLAGGGIEAEPVGSGTGCVVLLGESPPVEALAAVPSVVQDPAAALVVPYADPEPGDLVADLCAAPGGKAMALAARGNVVLAADRSLDRLQLLRENAERLAHGPWESPGFRVSVVQADTLAPIVEGADMALLDVPCTRDRHAPEESGRTLEAQSRAAEGAGGTSGTHPGGVHERSIERGLSGVLNVQPGAGGERRSDFRVSGAASGVRTGVELGRERVVSGRARTALRAAPGLRVRRRVRGPTEKSVAASRRAKDQQA